MRISQESRVLKKQFNNDTIMKVKCLSIKNPLSYLICAGIKDVENRTWRTDYRGTIYIHSSGSDAYHCYLKEYRHILKIHDELDKIQYDVNELPILPESLQYIGYDYDSHEYFLTEQGEAFRNEYEIIKAYNSTLHKNEPYFKSQAIIGKVELADIIEDSKSKWALKNCYHWILKDTELFDFPITHVKGKLRLFNYDLK